MQHPRQMHSLINVDEKVFIIGGNHCKKVECFNLHFEDYIDYPDLNYDRREAGLGLIRNEDSEYLYVFMGYSNTLGDTAHNLERLNLHQPIEEAKWQLLPIQNPKFLDNAYVTHFGVLNFKEGFLFIGGIHNTSCVQTVYYYNAQNYELDRTIYKLPFEAAFAEKNMFSFDDENFFLFTFGTNRLIKYDTKQSCLVELFQ